jgi:hypothetical protein
VELVLSSFMSNKEGSLSDDKNLEIIIDIGLMCELVSKGLFSSYLIFCLYLSAELF